MVPSQRSARRLATSALQKLLLEKEEALREKEEKWLREKAELEHKVQSLVSQVAAVGTITDRRRARNQVALASHREHGQ